jgi:hypothetical protein
MNASSFSDHPRLFNAELHFSGCLKHRSTAARNRELPQPQVQTSANTQTPTATATLFPRRSPSDADPPVRHPHNPPASPRSPKLIAYYDPFEDYYIDNWRAKYGGGVIQD